MTTPSGLTRIPGVPDSGEVTRGMAYFPGTGPYGQTCGDCDHRGYYRETERGDWKPRLQTYVTRAYHHLGCAMFKTLTGKHGPAIGTENAACKYFQQKAPR